MATAVGFDSRVRQHDTGPSHPEQIARVDAVLTRLKSGGWLDKTARLPERVASDDELALAHMPRYVELVDREVASHRHQLSTGDTSICESSSLAARAAVGCALSAVDAVLSGTVTNAFCVVRPPGHHASAARGMGFCLFNTVAVAARYAQKQHGVERVAIIDWDVHHGNGTQDIFYEDGSVLFFSTHQSPWYPGTGAARETGKGAGEGTTINRPFAAGSGATEIATAVTEVFAPAVKAFRPDLIIISAGFDSRIGDPLGQFTLTDRDFYNLTTRVMELASENCEDRLLSVLEGGYSLSGLAGASEAHVSALCAERPSVKLT